MSRHENPWEKLRRSLVKAREDRGITSARWVCVCMYVRATLRIFTIAVIKILQRARSARIVSFD